MVVVVLAVVIVLIDLILKAASLEVVENSGVAFGVDFPNSWLLVLFHILFVIVLLFWSRRVEQKILKGFLMFVPLVSLSNLIDRLFLGYVRDYIFVFGFHVNLADLAINAALLCIICILLKNELWTYIKLKKEKLEKG